MGGTSAEAGEDPAWYLTEYLKARLLMRPYDGANIILFIVISYCCTDCGCVLGFLVFESILAGGLELYYTLKNCPRTLETFFINSSEPQ